jgi:hypothetical protein
MTIIIIIVLILIIVIIIIIIVIILIIIIIIIIPDLRQLWICGQSRLELRRADVREHQRSQDARRRGHVGRHVI